MKERYFSLTDVCRKLAVKPHVLRYWEREFELTPKRNSAGRRIYSAAQVERLGLIKHLVRNERLTAVGVRQRLEKMELGTLAADAGSSIRPILLELKEGLRSIRDMLDASQPQ